MKYLSILSAVLFLSFVTTVTGWIKKEGKYFNINYTEKDKAFISEDEKIINTGVHEVSTFFDTAYKYKFEVFIHPGRKSLDSTWQINWRMPEFKSQCWMVASGVADRIDMISPPAWDTTSCEHKYAQKEKLQQLITHELVHVFHGQQNSSPILIMLKI